MLDAGCDDKEEKQQRWNGNKKQKMQKTKTSKRKIGKEEMEAKMRWMTKKEKCPIHVHFVQIFMLFCVLLWFCCVFVVRIVSVCLYMTVVYVFVCRKRKQKRKAGHKGKGTWVMGQWVTNIRTYFVTLTPSCSCYSFFLCLRRSTIQVRVTLSVAREREKE